MAASTITPSSRLMTSASLRARSEGGIEKRRPALTPLQNACRMTAATAMTVRTAIIRRTKMTTRSGIQGERPAKSCRQANRIAGAPVSHRLLRPKLERMAARNKHFVLVLGTGGREEGGLKMAASPDCNLHRFHKLCLLHTFCSLSFCSLVQIKTTRLTLCSTVTMPANAMQSGALLACKYVSCTL
jgi:hypothetical protein